MKKILLLISTIVFFLSCSSTLEERAKKQMRITFANEFKYANEFVISEEEVIYQSDSVFIMTFYLRGKKNNGEFVEGKMEYAYEERSMWAYNHPEVRTWNDYLRPLNSFSRNSVEEHLELMKEMTEKGYTLPKMTPFGIVSSAIFSTSRKVPSDYEMKREKYDKEKKYN